jgi:site-specific recombinase XerD
MLNEFSDWLKYNRNNSKYTIRNYMQALALFDDYLKQIWHPGVEECEDIKMRHIDGFVFEQRSFKHKGDRTVNTYLAAIKLYLRFCLIQ